MSIKNYLRKKISNIIKWAQYESYGVVEDTSVKIRRNEASRSSDLGVSLNFNVYNATGGKVVQFTTYDMIRDKHINNLYIINDSDDLGVELGHIITKESLTR